MGAGVLAAGSVALASVATLFAVFEYGLEGLIPLAVLGVFLDVAGALAKR